MNDDRAATEVLGYVLVISLITITIGVVMTLGIGGLEASQQSEQINNMERGFDVLSHNIGELVSGDAPSRATELRIVDGSLGYGESVTMNVTIGGTHLSSSPAVTNPIVYNGDSNTEISYENGALVRNDNGHSVMLDDPNIRISDDAITIHAIRTRPQGGSAQQVDRAGTVLLRGEFLGTEVERTSLSGSEDNLTITVNTQNVGAWESYFSQQDVGVTTVTENNVAYSMSVDEFEDDQIDVNIIVTRTRFVLIE